MSNGLFDLNFYSHIKEILSSARKKYNATNFAIAEACLEIGKSIVKKQGDKEKSEYRSALLKELSKQMKKNFGKGFTVSNFKNMRLFFWYFQIAIHCLVN